MQLAVVRRGRGTLLEGTAQTLEVPSRPTISLSVPNPLNAPVVLNSPAVPNAAALPVIPKAAQQKDTPNFEVADNVGLLGVEFRSFRAPNPIACREACEGEAACAGFQHGRKVPVMGHCALFSRIDARREDNQWRSGVRVTAPTAVLPSLTEPDRIVFPAPVARTRHGFKFYENVSLAGDLIKSTQTDSSDGCMLVCRNTARCIAAEYSTNVSSMRDNTNCHVYGAVNAAIEKSGAMTIVRSQPW